MKVVENKYAATAELDYSAIVKDEPTRPLEKIKEYDNDGVHYVEYNDGTVLTYTSTNTADTSFGVNWKTKKDYVNQMNWFNKILYYLWIIVPYKKLPIQQTGHLMNEEPFLQTLQASTYTSYWHWNWWNPLTYVVAVLFVTFMFLMNIVISIIQTLKMTSVVKINIKDN